MVQKNVLLVLVAGTSLIGCSTFAAASVQKVAPAKQTIEETKKVSPAPAVQATVNTPVAKILRWLSSGKKEANVVAVAIAACVAKVGLDILLSPFYAWSHHTQSQKVDGLTQDLRILQATMNANRAEQDFVVPVSVVNEQAAREQAAAEQQEVIERAVSEQFDAKLEDILKEQAAFKNLLAELKQQLDDYRNVTTNATLGEVGQSEDVGALKVLLAALEAQQQEANKQMAILTESVRQSNQTKADKLSMFTQKLEGIEGRLTINESQLKTFQETVNRKAIPASSSSSEK